MLAGDDLGGNCPYAAVPAAGLVGLAGPYDVSAVPDLAQPLFGVAPEGDRGLWQDGNPKTWADRHPSTSALLIHGGTDPIVPVSFTEDFAETLRAAGHDVSVELLSAADHDDVYQSQVVAQLVIEWIRRTLA
jgi:acetyl esterase/lipase